MSRVTNKRVKNARGKRVDLRLVVFFNEVEHRGQPGRRTDKS